MTLESLSERHIGTAFYSYNRRLGSNIHLPFQKIFYIMSISFNVCMQFLFVTKFAIRVTILN